MTDPLDRLRDANPVPDPDRLVEFDDARDPDHPELRALLAAARMQRNGRRALHAGLDDLALSPTGGPTEVPPMPTTDTDTSPDLTRTPRRSTWFVAAAAVALLLGTAIVVTQLLGDDVPDVADTPAPIVPDDGDDPSATAAQPGEGTLTFTFSGVEGDDGCRYTGPRTIVEGEWETTATNASNSYAEVSINVDRLADGWTYDRFLAHIGADSTDDFPLPAPRDESFKATSPGTYRTLHGGVPRGTTSSFDNSPMLVGEHVIICWTRHGGPIIWSDGVLTVVPAG